MRSAQKQVISDALARLRSGDQDVWVTIEGVRYKLGQPEIDLFEGGPVLLAVRGGYEVVTLFRRKGPHVGISRWQVESVPRPAGCWTSARKIRARILEAHVRDAATADRTRERDWKTYLGRQTRGRA